jgi:phosphohistidine swiveling domain-containing protein
MREAGIEPLDSRKPINQETFGSKAKSLANLKRIGLPVPAGFFIPASFYREHLERNNLVSHIKSALENNSGTEPSKTSPMLSELREAIINSPMAETQRLEIEKNYHSLSAAPLAVRSSATFEDLPGYSFAGQYESYLGVPGLADCIEAIKKCWASLWTQRAFDYRQKNGIDHFQVDMAVIVQELVPAEISGVMFTADPITGRRESLVIEACFGLGETLVSGQVTPDRFIFDKRKKKLQNQLIAEKKIKHVLVDNGTVQVQAVPADKSKVRTLHKKQTKRLAKLAEKIEAETGCPQDIEWAIKNGQIWLLQSRPITNLPAAKRKSWEERQVWSNMAAQEVLPDVVTPATLSLIENLAETMFDPALKALCLNKGNQPYYGVLAGRVYFNGNIWIAVIKTLSFARNYDFSKDIGSEPGLHEVFKMAGTMTDDDLPDLNFKRFRFFIKIPLLIIGWLANTRRKGQRIIKRTKKINNRWQSVDPNGLSIHQIVSNCNGIIEDFRDLCGEVLYLLSGMAAYPALETICSKWIPDQQQCAKRLLAGIGEMEDANSGLDLWRLALLADAYPQIKGLIQSKDNWKAISGKIQQVKSGREFLASWDEFMDRHGFHCRAEIELINARWAETPDYILSLLRSYVGSIGKTNPLLNHTKLEEQRRQLIQKCHKKLRNPLKRFFFNCLLARAQWGCIFRENIKCEIVRLIANLRIMLLELGRKLHDESIIQNPEDVFFLKLDELEPLIQGRADFDAKATIAKRRAEYDYWQTITPPGTIIGKYDPDKSALKPIDANTEILKGLAVSAGVAEGKARVILRTDTNEQILPGEILVAPFTDPGWTPYFIPAAGIVMDQGSLLSHGSIVAREYGIPAVVNVGHATKIIKTGQKIQVDGNTGAVRTLG